MKATNIYVNLPVKDLQRSVTFFTSLGFEFNAQFTNENGTCLMLGEQINVMLLLEPFFQTFLTKPMADARQTTGVLTAFGLGSRAEVDQMLSRALAAGGTEPRPLQDHGWMYSRAFEDLDGHVWEPVYSDLSLLPAS
jgi:hypothetical protein